MTDAVAAAKADQYLLALITNHPGACGANALLNVPNAQSAAANIAAFRQRLIDDLKKQAD